SNSSAMQIYFFNSALHHRNMHLCMGRLTGTCAHTRGGVTTVGTSRAECELGPDFIKKRGGEKNAKNLEDSKQRRLKNYKANDTESKASLQFCNKINHYFISVE
ncbi:hypothetical protein STEG23_034481, partial [Scotinomys teguina]